MKLFDSERKVMECLWDEGDMSAKEIAEKLERTVGWSKPTTYTIIRKCVSKDCLERIEPGFICHALITREYICSQETEALIERNYGGNADRLVASLIDNQKLSKEDIEQLKKLIQELS